MPPISASHKSRCELCQRIEHGLQIERRAADDLENVGGGDLLLQRRRKFSRTLLLDLEQPTFSIAITAWSAKVVQSSICLSVYGCERPARQSCRYANQRFLAHRGTPRMVRKPDSSNTGHYLAVHS